MLITLQRDRYLQKSETSFDLALLRDPPVLLKVEGHRGQQFII